MQVAYVYCSQINLREDIFSLEPYSHKEPNTVQNIVAGQCYQHDQRHRIDPAPTNNYKMVFSFESKTPKNCARWKPERNISAAKEGVSIPTLSFIPSKEKKRKKKRFAILTMISMVLTGDTNIQNCVYLKNNIRFKQDTARKSVHFQVSNLQAKRDSG